MKKLVVILSLVFYFGFITTGYSDTKTLKDSVVLYKDSATCLIKSQTVHLIETDTAIQRAIINAGFRIYKESKSEEVPYMKIISIISTILLVIGGIVRKIPTSKPMWWLQPLNLLLDFFTGQNNKTDGGVH